MRGKVAKRIRKLSSKMTQPTEYKEKIHSRFVVVGEGEEKKKVRVDKVTIHTEGWRRVYKGFKKHFKQKGGKG